MQSLIDILTINNTNTDNDEQKHLEDYNDNLANDDWGEFSGIVCYK